MTRRETLDQISATIEQLPDERLSVLLELAQAWAAPTIYSTLGDDERAQIDEAAASLDRGEGIPGEEVFSEIRRKIEAARSRPRHGR